MKTLVYNYETGKAADIIKNGGLVAVPTETVYGLACNGLDSAAVKKIYDVKGRPEIKPLSLMIHDASHIKDISSYVPRAAEYLAERFWPGPLTIVLNSKEIVPGIVRAGGTTIGLRCPDSELTLKLLEESEVPFAAPSANPSGMPSPKDADDVIRYFDGLIDAVIDGGKCGLGQESTIIDMSCEPYKILRQGALPAEDITDALVENLQIVGITGGTGSGKTTALDVLSDFGACIIDCDSVYHFLLENSDELREEIKNAFPGIFSGKEFDRKKLGSYVFKDENALSVLNEISHKYIREEVIKKLRTFAMSGGELAAIDAIALFDSGLDKLCDFTVGVLAPAKLRIKRIMERDGISEEYAQMRIKAQKDDNYFESRCTKIVVNDSDSNTFKKIFSELIKGELENGRS